MRNEDDKTEDTNTSQKESVMNEKEKKTIVDGLVAHCNCWEEEDREVLNSFDDKKLEALKDNVTTNTERKTQLEKVGGKFKDGEREYTWNEDKQEWIGDGEIAPKEETVTATVTNDNGTTQTKPTEPPKPKTVDEYLADMPAGIRSTVQNAMAFETAQKEELIKVITTNELNRFSPEALATKDLGELQAIAAFAAPAASPSPAAMPAPMYAGAQGAPQQVANVDDGFDENDTLVPPVWNEEKNEFALA